MAIVSSLLTYKIIYITTAFISVVFVFFIFTKTKREKFNIFYALTNVSIVIWAIGRYALLVSANQETALFLARILHIGSIAVHILFLHTILIFLGVNKSRKLPLTVFYIIGGFTLFLNIFDLLTGSMFFVAGVTSKLIFPWVEVRGKLYNLHLMNELVIPIYVFIEMIFGLFREQGVRKQQLGLIITASFLGFIGGNMVIFSIYDIAILPIGVLLIPLNFLIMTFAIFRYRLMNIRVIATEFFALVLITTLLIELILSGSFVGMVIRSIFFAFALIFGYFLTRSAYRDAEQREQIETLNTQLQKSMNELRKIDELKTEFVSLASHQLRTPLTPIKGFSDMLLEGSVGGVVENQEQKNAIKMINESANRMDNLIDDILDVSKLEKEGGFTYAFQLANPEEVIKKVVDDFTKQAKDKGLELSFTSTLLPTTEVKLDPVKFTDAIGNLLSNSVKYTIKGTIWVNISEEEGNVVISVKDTGVGIEPEDMPRLFQKFFRGKEMARLDAMGTGLGLYFTRHVIEDHGGHITVQSEGPQKGSEFIVRLPKVTSEKQFATNNAKEEAMVFQNFQ